ncbi:MAG TPA: glycoside hydrolase family 88 protein [Candidatus Limnocylindrales bacterium]|nr:glycoside hydrolase family 88 protein [Candidatus Limnocylindrales bacterium]
MHTRKAASALVLSLLLLPAPTQAASSVYEAESAVISQGVVESNHAGFSGTGFVNYDNVVGSYVEWTVNAPSDGSYALTIRYANGTTANRPMSINGQTANFPGTGAWSTWAEVTITINLITGANQIRATATTVDGGPNVDNIAIDAAAVVYEAEDTGTTCLVETEHTGFTGTGYVNCDNASGSFLEFIVSSGSAGTTDLHVRYANGTTASRPATLTVNGASVATPSFPSTGVWTNWSFQSITAPLTAGTNTIRLIATTANGLANIDSLTVGGSSPTRDWSDLMVRSTMQRFTPGTIGGWSYPVALYLYGQYQVYLRTGDPARLAYIRQWADRFVAADGTIGQSFNNLDSMLGGRVLLILYKETGQAKYRTAAQKIRTRLNTYPKTSDGGYWHSTSESRVGQLWSDGVFMSMPFLAEWGRDAATTQSDRDFSFNTAVNQLLIYAGHLQQPNGLMKHAYDEPRDETWSDDITGLAPEYWCRAIGWFGMATHMVLDTIPAAHPQRGQLVAIIQNLVRGFETYQDPATGRWFQVVDKGNLADNWTETSCSAMFTYTIDRAIEKGYVPAAQYRDNADRGFQGVLNKIRLGGDGLTNLDTISEGTNVGNYSYYINRAQRTNDFHGLGAFIIMFEQLR